MGRFGAFPLAFCSRRQHGMNTGNRTGPQPDAARGLFRVKNGLGSAIDPDHRAGVRGRGLLAAVGRGGNPLPANFPKKPFSHGLYRENTKRGYFRIKSSANAEYQPYRYGRGRDIRNAQWRIHARTHTGGKGKNNLLGKRAEKTL